MSLHNLAIRYATYELVGTHPLSSIRYCRSSTKHTNRIVKPEEVLLTDWLDSDPRKSNA